MQKKFFVLKFILEGDFVRIYLDMCCYNRQFDEKISDNDFIEVKSVIQIQKEILLDNLDLVTSFMLHYENYRKKISEQRDKIDLFIKTYRKFYVGVDNIENLKIISQKIISQGIKEKDAYHISSAIFANCDYFITFDKKLLKFYSDFIKIINPVDFMEVYKNGCGYGR